MYAWNAEWGSGGDTVLRPGARCEAGKLPGPPPRTTGIQTSIGQRGVVERQKGPLNSKKDTKSGTHDTQSDQVRHRNVPDPVEPNREVMVKHAAARRATRRLPLGEPPLVITTHAITSFRSSHPDSAGVQPRAVSGSSPSCHGSTTRKSTERVFSSERHPQSSLQSIPDQQATGHKKKRSPPAAFVLLLQANGTSPLLGRIRQRGGILRRSVVGISAGAGASPEDQEIEFKPRRSPHEDGA